jgi:hypothetical protein
LTTFDRAQAVNEQAVNELIKKRRHFAFGKRQWLSLNRIIFNVMDDREIGAID